MKTRKKILAIIIIMFLFLALDTFFYSLKPFYLIFWIVMTILLLKLLGHKKDLYIYKIDVTQITLIYTLTYFVLIYLSGLFLGFTKTPYNLEILKIFKNIAPIIITITLEEICRFTILKKTKNKFLIILLTLFLILFQIKENINLYNTNTPLDIYDLISNLIIPIIIRNILFTYITYKSTIIPSLIYRLIFETYIYIIPIVPDLGIYFESILNLVFPTILFLRLNTLFSKQKFKKKKFLNIIITFPILTILLAITLLASNKFKYSLIAIASNSMNPSIARGDAVIVEKIKQLNNLQIGDILVYKHEEKTIIHRITEIRKVNNKYIFRTKGDNNSNIDAYQIKETDVIGKTNVKLPYIGYPSVWLSEKLG